MIFKEYQNILIDLVRELHLAYEIKLNYAHTFYFVDEYKEFVRSKLS